MTTEPAQRQRHWMMLGIALAVVLLALTLEVRSDGRVHLAFLPQFPLPESCISRSALGIKCPGCGLTRSFVFLAHGRPVDAWGAHRLGWLLGLTLLAQFPYRIWALTARRMPQALGVWSMAFGHLLIGLLILNWLWP